MRLFHPSRRSPAFAGLLPIYAALVTLVAISLAGFVIVLWPADSRPPERAQRAEGEPPPGQAVEGSVRPDPESRPKNRMKWL